MQQHEEIKKEVCQHCELKFKNVEHLRRHLVAKHFPEKIKCDFCPSQLSAKCHYKKHLIKIHKETDKEVLKKVDKILVDYKKMKFIV